MIQIKKRSLEIMRGKKLITILVINNNNYFQ